MWKIENLIPTYPDIDDKNFYQTIFNKKEFNVLTDDKYSKDIYFSHQRFIKRFISPYTPYDGILLFHSVGTGKSCSAIAVAEAHKINKHCIVLVKNNTVKENFLQQLSSVCTKNEYTPTVKEEKIRRLTKFYTKQGKSKQEIEDLLKKVKLTEREFIVRRNKKTSKNYTIEKFREFTNSLAKQSESEIITKYSNNIIVIDEVQNLKIYEEDEEEKKKKEGIKKETIHTYDVIHKFLHLIKNIKILLLSATPMVNDVNEIASIFNLILPLSNQMPIEDEFNNKFMTGNKIINKDELFSFFKGRVSYIRKVKEMPLKIELGKTISPLLYFKVIPCYISEFQKNIYKDIKEEGYYIRKSQALDFIFPDETFSKIGFNTNVKLVDKRYKFKSGISTSIKNNLLKYSCKYNKCIKTILENPEKLCLVFNRFVKGSGLVVFSLILELYGFSKYIHDEKTKAKIKRYAIITGKTPKEEVENILKIFNSFENRYGNVIQVLLISKVLGEARTIKNLRQVHILSPYWNIALIDQIIGRGYRAFSHYDLKVNERVLEVYKYVSISKEFYTSDILLYQKSENKDILIKQIERLLKESSSDCAVFYDSNIILDKNYTRECDYEKCVYRCKDILPFGNGDIPIYKPTGIIDDSYYTYYYKEELDHVKNILLKLLPDEKVLTIFDLLSILSDFDPKIVTMTINDIIVNNIEIKDKYGYVCYLRLREIDNILYLVKDIYDDKFSDSLYFYEKTLVPLPRLSFVNAMYVNKTNKDIEIINGFKDKDTNFIIKRLDKLSKQTKRILLERILSKVFRKEKINEKDKAILELFKDYIDYDHEKHNYAGIRCFIRDMFIDCPRIKITKLGEKLTEEEKKIVDNKYKIYGILLGDVFQIASKYKEKEIKREKEEKIDKRKLYSGKICATFPKSDLVEICFILGIEPPDLEKFEESKAFSKTNLISELRKVREFSSFSLELENKAKNELNYFYSFKKIKKPFICELLKNWLIKNNMVLRL